MHVRNLVLLSLCAMLPAGSALATPLKAHPQPVVEAALDITQQRDAPRCVKYSRRSASDGLFLKLDNRCDEGQRCDFSWQLRCAGDPADTPRAGAETLVVEAGTKADTFASAADCGESRWRISKVSWSCEAL